VLHSIQYFFDSTHSQQAEKYQREIDECEQKQTALTDYLTELYKLELSIAFHAEAPKPTTSSLTSDHPIKQTLADPLSFNTDSANSQNAVSTSAESLHFPARISLSNIRGIGFTINQEKSSDQLGAGLSVGDMDGDGVSDILIGAPQHNQTGSAYLVLGSKDLGNTGSVSLTPGAGISHIDGEIAGSRTGDSLNVMQNVKTTGKAAMLVGAGSGRVYAIFKPSGGPNSPDNFPWWTVLLGVGIAVPFIIAAACYHKKTTQTWLL
jgi:hypothetical protein